MELGLALGGGGAKGLGHIPFLLALDELGIRPAIVAGSSIGAIVGGLYASGVPAADLADLLSAAGVRTAAFAQFSFVPESRPSSARGVLARFLHTHLRVRTFAELPIPCVFVASDVWTREQVTMDEGDLVSAICASSALPGLMKPVLREGRTLIDGSCVNPVPFDIIRSRVRYCAAINVGGTKEALGYGAPNRRESLFHAFQIMQSAILREKLKGEPPDFIAAPELKNIRVLDFHRAGRITESAQADVDRFKRWIETVLDPA